MLIPNLLSIIFLSFLREICLFAIPLAQSIATSSKYSTVLSSGLFNPGPMKIKIYCEFNYRLSFNDHVSALEYG